MAVPPSTVPGTTANSSALDTYYNLRAKLERSQQNVQDMREKFLTARATVYFLANPLQRHDVSLAIPADSAVLRSNNSGGRSAQPSYLQSSTTQLSGTPGPGHQGCSSPGSGQLEKNLIEIHTLRQRLEESVCINDRLRERLGHVLSSIEQGKSTAQSALTVSITVPRSCTQSHSSGSGQDSL